MFLIRSVAACQGKTWPRYVYLRVVIKTLTKAYLFDSFSSSFNSTSTVRTVKTGLRTGIRISPVTCHFQQENDSKGPLIS